MEEGTVNISIERFKKLEKDEEELSIIMRGDTIIRKSYKGIKWEIGTHLRACYKMGDYSSIEIVGKNKAVEEFNTIKKEYEEETENRYKEARESYKREIAELKEEIKNLKQPFWKRIFNR